MSTPGFEPTEQFDHRAMASFMRQPEIYWQCADALAPQPEDVQLEAWMADQWVWTLACTAGGYIIGYVQTVQRNPIGAEFHCAFHANFRGRVAKAFVEYAIARCFTDRRLLKLWCTIPSDNRPAILGAKACGFEVEGRLTKATMRSPAIIGRKFPKRWSDMPGLRDIVILGLSKDAAHG